MMRRLNERHVLARHAAIKLAKDNWAVPGRTAAKLFFGASLQVDLREVVGQNLFVYGAFEEALSQVFWDLLRPGMSFVDGGAHVGYFSLLARHRVGATGRVLAVEPMPMTCRILRDNLAAYPNVVVVEHALWSQSTMVNLNDYGPERSAFNSIAPMRGEGQDVVTPVRVVAVQARTLDDLAAEFDLTPDVVKLDVESAELDALKGMTRLLESVRPIVSIEVGDFPALIEEGVPSSRETLSYLVDRGYRLFEATLSGVRPHELKDHGAYAYDNIVAVPPERQRLLDTLGVAG